MVPHTISNPTLSWIVLAVIVAGIAQGKNRPAGAWFGWSLIFGPVALVCLVALVPKLPDGGTR